VALAALSALAPTLTRAQPPAAPPAAARPPAVAASDAPGAAAAAPALTLEEAVRAVVARNERAQAAGARAEASEARVASARAFFFPQLSVTGAYTRRPYQTTRNVGGEEVVLQRFDAFSGRANLTVPLLNARGFPLYRQATLERDAARAEAGETQRLLAFEAADAFLATLSAEQVARAAERRLAFARTALREAQVRAEAKLVSSNDVTRATLEVASAERDSTRARGEVQTAYLQLGNLLNAPVQAPLGEPDALLAEAGAAEPAAVDAEVAAEADVLARRLDLQALRTRAQALSVFTTEADLRWLPSLDAVAEARGTSEPGLTGRVIDGSAGLALTWDLFDGGLRLAQRRERSALARATALDAANLERAVGVQVDQARVALRNAQAALAQAQVAADAAERNAEEAQVLYKEGLAGSLQVADANIRLFEAQVALARERYGLALALLDVRAAAGFDPLGKEWTL
jgi:outer membrane protein TolC